MKTPLRLPNRICLHFLQACLILLCCFITAVDAQPQFKGVRENLGKEINDQYDQVRPVFSLDGTTLFFSQGSGKNLLYEIWRTTVDSAGRITGKELVKALDPNTDAPKFLLQPLNSHSYTVNAVYNVVSNRLHYSRGISKIELGKNDIEFHPDYFQKQTHPVLDSLFRRRAILPVYHSFSGAYYWSDGPEGQQDIYFLPVGTDSNAALIKLPAPVNTDADELTPWLDDEGHYLYFASNRPGGQGETDIWVTERLDGSFKNWSKPVNLGPAVNTNKSESHFIIDPGNVYAYLASDKSGFGRNDLYRIALRQADSLSGSSPIILQTDKPDTSLLIQPQTHLISNIVFLLDISHSMAQSRKMVLLKKAMYRLTQQLRPYDRISIVTFGSGVEVVLSPQWVKTKADIYDAIQMLHANGGATNISAGLQRAYEQAVSLFLPGENNQLMLVTDGIFHLKPADEQLVMSHRDITLTAVVVGNNEEVSKSLAPLLQKANGQMLNLQNEATSLNLLLQNIRSNARRKK